MINDSSLFRHSKIEGTLKICCSKQKAPGKEQAIPRHDLQQQSDLAPNSLRLSAMRQIQKQMQFFQKTIA